MSVAILTDWRATESLLRDCEEREPEPSPPCCPEEARHRSGLPMTMAGVLCFPRGTCDVSGALLWAGSSGLGEPRRIQAAYLVTALTRYPWRVRVVTPRGVCRGDGRTLEEAVDLALETDDQKRLRIVEEAS